MSGADPTTPARTPGRSPAAAFGRLYAAHAAALTRQALLLTGDGRRAERAVERAFQRAWQHWPEVARAADPAAWVRVAAYDAALSPWPGWSPGSGWPAWRARPAVPSGPPPTPAGAPGRRRGGRSAPRGARRRGGWEPPVPPRDRVVLRAVARLPRHHRRSLVLHEVAGVPLADAARETEATPTAAAARLDHARRALVAEVPRLAMAPGGPGAGLAELAAALPVEPRLAVLVRRAAERRARVLTRVVLGVTAGLVVLVAGVSLRGAG